MPLKSGGVVDTEFMRGRANVGIIGAGKAALLGELKNGGFETGDLSFWTACCFAYTPGVSAARQHTGSYSCSMGTKVGWFGDDIYIEQSLTAPRTVSSIAEFYLWKYGQFRFAPNCGAGTRITITYTDDTTTIIDHTTTLANRNMWLKIDILPSLVAGKTVKKIRITNISEVDLYVAYWVDDVTLI